MKKMSKLKVDGKVFELEERTCKGGCGLRFKTLLNSDQEYARHNCYEVCKDGKISREEHKKKFNHTHRSQKKRDWKQNEPEDLQPDRQTFEQVRPEDDWC